MFSICIFLLSSPEQYQIACTANLGPRLSLFPKSEPTFYKQILQLAQHTMRHLPREKLLSNGHFFLSVCLPCVV